MQTTHSDSSRLHGYYFFLPIKPRKGRGKASELDALSAFGPYRSPHEASFIRTSARALGLLEPDAIEQDSANSFLHRGKR